MDQLEIKSKKYILKEPNTVHYFAKTYDTVQKYVIRTELLYSRRQILS